MSDDSDSDGSNGPDGSDSSDDSDISNGFVVSTDSGNMLTSNAQAENEEDTESAASDSDSSSDSSSDSDEDSDGDSDEDRNPSWHQQRKDKFVKRVRSERFWVIEDEVEMLTPLSIFFLRHCTRTSDVIDDLETFILPAEVEERTTNVPTERANDRTELLIKLKDKKFLQAVQELQLHLRKDFEIEWLTLPFSPTDPEGYKVANKKAKWASDTHKEVVRLFAKTVNKMHQVKLLVTEADARGTAATSRLYTKVQAATYMETVRKNMWILNNRFEYDRSTGGFCRIGDKRKGAIALMSSAASAAKVVGGKPNVRPRHNNNRRWQYNKRPRKDLRNQDDMSRQPSLAQEPHESGS